MTLASKTESEGFFFTLSGLSGMRHGQRGDVHVGPGARSSDGLAPRFYFTFQAEDAFLPVRAALNVETCQFQSPYCSCRAPHF